MSSVNRAGTHFDVSVGVSTSVALLDVELLTIPYDSVQIWDATLS